MIVTSTVHTNGDARKTGQLMHLMVEQYYTDMVPYAHLSLRKVFDIIKRIPFRPDPPDAETLMRPFYTMHSMGTGGDCDDKAIALASYCKLKGIPYRFVAVRRADEKLLHHVYLECYIENRWVHADPTYRFNSLGREREQYAEYVFM